MAAPPGPTEYTKTQTTSYFPVQDGYMDDDLGFWIDTGGGLILGTLGAPSGASNIGLQFQMHTLDADQGYSLNPPIIQEPRPLDIVTGAAEETTPFSLRLSTVPGLNLAAGTFVVHFVPEVNPAPFSTASPPFSRGELGNVAVGALVYGGLDPTRQIIDLDFLTVTNAWNIMEPFIRHPNWRGRVAFSILWFAGTGRTSVYSSEGAPTLAETPELQVRECPFHTGMMVGHEELQLKSRAVHSYKSGFPYLSNQAIPDGFTEGIMMHPDDYDPIDPVAQGHGDYVPSPKETEVDDDVTDLEG
jgi:hypothetical protein